MPKKLKRKKKKENVDIIHKIAVSYRATNDPQRELTPEEIVRGMESRLGHVQYDYTREQVINTYYEKGMKEAIAECKRLCINGGSASDGFWVSGGTAGVTIEIHDYKTRSLVAKGTIPYKKVTEYAIQKYEEEQECRKSKRSPIKLKRKKKLKKKKLG